MNESRSQAPPAPPRLLGLLPIAFVGWAFTTYDDAANLLWLCNLSNLLLGAGLIASNLRLIWVATLWLLPGFPLWVVDMFVQDQFYPHSVFTHIVAPSLGLYALRRRAPQKGAWILAVAFGLAAQAVCRWWTPAELNINVSHMTYAGFTGWLNNYYVYWTISVLALSVVLFALERVLIRFLAARPIPV